jgi:squalene-hopene/tetraprenyl-beta-curcumene cyclase
VNAPPLAFRSDVSAPTDSLFHNPKNRIGPAIDQLSGLLLERQHADGSWCEHPHGAAPIEAEAMILLAFLGIHDDPRMPRLARALLDRQLADGGWTGLPDGPADVDATATACLALTLAATSFGSSALERGRARLASWGTAGGCSGYTRLLLALFGMVPHADDWTTLPTCTPVEAWAVQVLDVYRPVRSGLRDQALAGLFRDELRLPSGPVLNPIRRWNARRAAHELEQRFMQSAETTNGPTTILPALALGCLALPNDSPAWQLVWRDLDERTRSVDDRDWLSPFLSPLRDTALAVLALRATGFAADSPPITSASEWIWQRLVRGQSRGDLAIADAALAVTALARTGHAFRNDRHTIIEHVIHALLDEQDAVGGWGSADLTGLVLEALAEYGLDIGEPAVVDAVDFLKDHQTAEGSWPGTMGVNFLFGTWRVLSALRAIGMEPRAEFVRRAVDWIKRSQQVEGGWGDSKNDAIPNEPTAAHTAWAVQSLIAANEAHCPAIEAGIDWLLAINGLEGTWHDLSYTGRDPRGPHRHALHALAYPLAALAQFERSSVGYSCQNVRSNQRSKANRANQSPQFDCD